MDVEGVIVIEGQDRLQVAGVGSGNVGLDHRRRVGIAAGSKLHRRHLVIAVGANPASSPDHERGGETGAAKTTECSAPRDIIRERGHRQLLLSVCSLGQVTPELPAHLAVL